MKLMRLPLSYLRESSINLNIDVDENLIELEASMQSIGLKMPITVADRGTHCIIVDGRKRFKVAQKLQWQDIDCLVMNIDDQNLLEAQILASTPYVRTKPAQYRKALLIIINQTPTMRFMDLAELIAWKPQKLRETLGLNKIGSKIWPLVRVGKIVLANAVALAKLPVSKQKKFELVAQTDTPNVFIPKVLISIKESSG